MTDTLSGESMTYDQLDSLARRTAAKLAGLGVKSGDFVTVELPRSMEYIAALLGVWYAGAAYVPLSGSYPEDRLAYIRENCKAAAVIDPAFMSAAESEQPLENTVFPDESANAVLIYTSGSTGRPKGVLHDFASVAGSVLRYSKLMELDENTRHAIGASLTFVASLQAVWAPLTLGLTDYLLPYDAIRDPAVLADTFDRFGITHSFISPKILKMFRRKGSSLKYVIVGGERVSNTYHPDFTVICSFGQTETGAAATAFRIDRKYENTPIGKAIDGVNTYVLDENGKEASEGELCISGHFASCYLGLPEQSAGTFVKNPFKDRDGNEDMVRTGDIVRLDENGDLIYLERRDWMVKINGQRVEPGETETRLSQIEGVSASAVRSFTDSNGQTFLCGYYTSPEKLSDSFIRDRLAETLPAYMIPRFIMHLEKLPLNENGKLDRKTLPEPRAEDFAAEYRAPQTEEEKLVCKAFEELLGVEKAGADDDFFALGGDSIKAVLLQEKLLGYSLSAGQIFEKRTPSGIAACLSAKEKTSFVFEEREAYPMTDPQLGIYLANIRDTGSLEYNNPVTLFLGKDAPVSAQDFADAVKRTAGLYPSVKVCARTVDSVPCMIPVPDMEIEVPVISTDITDEDELCRAFVRPFDLENGPLFRFAVYDTPAGIIFISDVHHIITDGTSLSLFMKNLSLICSGKEPAAETVNSFMLSTYEQEQKSGERFEECRKFFDNMLAGVETDSNLIADEITEKAETNGGVLRCSTSGYADAGMIQALCKKLGITENTLFLGAFAYALAKQSGQELASLCVVENGRHIPELQYTFGMLVHTLPLCIKAEDEKTVSDYLSEVQKILFGSLEHDLVSIVQLANEYEVSSDILFVYQGEMFGGSDFFGKTVTPKIHKTGDAVSKLSLDVFKEKDGYTLSFEFRKDLYLEETVKNFSRLYLNIVKGLTECDRLSEIELCSEYDREFIRRANDNKVEFDRSLTLTELFRRQAEAHPDNIAVSFKGKSLTYAELDRYSENLARLLARLGVKRENPVGIMVKRCELFPICTLGVLKAGGACQPLDSNYPQDRLEYMLEDSKAKIVIADDELAGLIPSFGGTVISANGIYDLPEDRETELDAPDAHTLFALIYTSGSTGKPKGCMLEHANLVNFCISFAKKFDVTENDRFAAYGAFGFDASMQDLYPALTSGASVYIVPEETRLDLVGLHEFVIGNKITMMDCTTQLGRQYITAYPESPYMRIFTVGGEKLVPCQPPEFEFWNTYGPTECTIYVSDYRVDRQYESVPIGKSFGNCDIYILDKCGRMLPAGAVGELAVSGYPVTRGYLGRPDLTSEKFIENRIFSIEGYERTYLTGDVCRYLPNGNIQFVGRRDEQVKIRGFRIELTEIERRIREYEGITDASVIAVDLPSGGKAVAAYVVSQSKIDVPSLNRFVADELPPYMVPSVTMQIDSIPITPNGKVDKRKLPKPSFQSDEGSAPRQLSSLEKRLCETVSGITGFECTRVTESLISIGLTSLTTIMFAAKLFEEYGLKVGVTELMDDSCTLMTVEDMIIENLLSRKDGAPAESAHIQRTSSELGSEQLGVYYDSMKQPTATVYNIPVKYTFPKKTDVRRLKESLEKLILATPVLYSCIVLDSNGITQQVIENFKPDIPVISLDNDKLGTYMKAFVKPFNLSKGPLFRAGIIETGDSVVLLFDAHHVIMDGLSLSVFISKLTEIYTDGTEPEISFSYYDYIAEEAEQEKSEKGEKAREYYRELFADYENASDITPDLNGEPENGALGEAACLVDRSRTEEFCRAGQVTPAALFLAASQYAVSRCTGDRQVYMSMISGGRQDVRYIDSVGMFVKNLPLHAVIDTERTAMQFVSDTAAAMTAAQKNSVYPFIKLFDKYGFASKINYACQLGIEGEIRLEGETVTEEAIITPAPKFSLSVHIEESGADSIAVKVQYNTALYSEKAAMMISSAIARTAEQIMAEPERRLCRISMITDAESRMLADFACGGNRNIPIRLFHALFEAQAQQHPDRTALVACDASYTYAGLNNEMNRLANALGELGVRRGDRVAILLPRTSRQIIAMYGVLKAGAAYIPCDPEYPQERVDYILENSGAKFIITDAPRGCAGEIFAEDLLKCENTSAPDSGVSPDDTAYLIYTSGSTGRPKGVEVSHGSIANYLTPYPENIHIKALADEGSVYVSVTTVSFDMSLKETAAALCNGLTLVLADEAQTKDPNLLCELFEKTHGDVFNATPSRLEQYMLLESFRSVLAGCRIIMCGGEKYSPKLLENLKKVTGARIFNTYGPTEITVSCNAKELTDQTEICVGRPLLNVNEYIVDNDGNLLPKGAVGELWVGGTGVAKGYLNNPELTAKSFRELNGERIYKTGDRARWTDSGDIMILGRNDDQVKLRGLRIELGEVEKAILSCEGVKQAVAVIGKINSVEHLCAYYCAEESITPDVVKEHISKRLAAYMIPSCLIRMDAMPQTPNGKTDVRALPEPYLSFNTEFSEPANETEKLICDIFAQVLGLDRVSADSSFFDLGGTSLSVTSVLVNANEKGLEISYTDIFALKTPRALAAKALGQKNDDDGLSGFDYSIFDSILKGNAYRDGAGEPNSVGDLLLTGSTGFLGIHILKSFLENSSGKVYCLVREKKDVTPEQFLKGMLHYYFSNGYDRFFTDRIFMVKGSVTSDDWFEQLRDTKIDTVINCAALVKHFSDTDDIERVNAGGVKNLIRFCKEHNSMLVQISTGSVAGDRVNNYPAAGRDLDENSFYFGQYIDNQYVKSKFLAERYVLEAVKDGLRAKIMRVGNLAPRASDGEFQINFSTNGFMGRLRAFNLIGAFPYSMMNYPIEFAPIDETAEAIMKLCTTPDNCVIFHPFNNHFIPLGDIILRMKESGLDIRLSETDDFTACFDRVRNDRNKASMLTTLLAYDNKDSSKKVEMIRVDNDYTTQVLYRLGFSWSMTAESYITSFIDALSGLCFFDAGGDD
ncbi:MAG: amino acid adenylation domain-containing protein [Ruminococcus sp.]|nr:amino acid adenylation domain-containing protein [Ruminococcus sp.]